MNLEEAQLIIHSALGHARDNAFPPMTVAVLDPAGSLLAFAREDGSSLLREKIARGKAMGALNMGIGSRALAARAESHPHFINSLVALSNGELIPVPGGVLVRDSEGHIVGAVGVSGHVPDSDEDVAVAGIAATAHSADPGA
jgi:uncharacterized protein GlcG (DUF336 family)